jgi:hypothetical protein
MSGSTVSGSQPIGSSTDSTEDPYLGITISTTSASGRNASTLPISSPSPSESTDNSIDSSERWLVDLGYVSWIYGVFQNYGGWDTKRHSYRGSLMCLDSKESWRKSIAPGYKQRRADRRDRSEEAAIRKAKVEAFRAMVLEDFTLELCWIDGFEADDVLAIHALQDPSCKVVAVDKDLLQVPGLYARMFHHHGEPAWPSIRGANRKYPKFWPAMRSPRDVLLAQLLFGDRSDSIPRMLKARDKWTAQTLFREEAPFQRAWLCFDQGVLLSTLKQLVIPAVALHRDYHRFVHSPLDWMAALDSGSYWDAGAFPHLCPVREEEW